MLCVANRDPSQGYPVKFQIAVSSQKVWGHRLVILKQLKFDKNLRLAARFLVLTV